jgi:mannose/cellobiose epimerase-like protein (N-acyl-D-glucosamine 2-epimerase family)
MLPDFRSRAVLLQHIRHTRSFYDPRCTDPSGGFYHFYKDDGRVYDARTRHLVSSTRFVFNFAMAWRQFGEAADRERMLHGLRFLREAHRNPITGGYAWTLDWHDGDKTVTDDTNHCYGLAFVLLAYAHALMAGVEEARAWIDETWDLMEARFWEAQYGLTGRSWRPTAARTPTCTPAKPCWRLSMPPATPASCTAPRPWPTISPCASPPSTAT